MATQDRTVERAVARIAAGQHGVASRTQLRAAGISANEIHERLRRGALIPMYRGVYRAGHAAPSLLATFMAAVLACGDGAVLCGWAAAYLHGLIRSRPTCPEVLTRTERRIPGVRTIRARAGIDARDATRARGIPVTTVPRTLIDLAAILHPRALARACHEAEVRHRTTPAAVWAVLERRPNARGAAELRRILAGDERVVLSRLEERFLELLEQAGLPLPITNRPAGGHYVDCRWPEHGLTVELDGYRFHNSRHSWEQDRQRERRAYARGDDFRRITYGDVFERPKPTLRELISALSRR